MMLKDFLSKKKGNILDRWFELILETYPAETSKLMREKDPFINPVGCTFAGEIEAIYEGLLHGVEAGKLSGHLDKIVQIRSVQDFSPSRAVLIVPLLKKAIQEELGPIGIEGDQVTQEWKEWFNLDSKIDQLSLVAFDIYTKCRERIYEIRISEIKKERERLSTLWERTNPKRE